MSNRRSASRPSVQNVSDRSAHSPRMSRPAPLPAPPQSDSPSDGWERFWFAPLSPGIVVLQRWVLAGLACLFFASYWSDAPLWFGSEGFLSTERLGRLVLSTDAASEAAWHLSPLYIIHSPWALRGYLAAGMGAAVAVGCGLGGRSLAALLLLAALGLANREWIISEPGELPLLVGLGALVIAGPTPRGIGRRGAAHWSYGLATRWMQVHVILFLITSAAGRLAAEGGTEGLWRAADWVLTWVPVVGMIDLAITKWIGRTRRMAPGDSGAAAARSRRPVALLVAYCLVAGAISEDPLSAAAMATLMLSFLNRFVRP